MSVKMALSSILLCFFVGCNLEKSSNEKKEGPTTMNADIIINGSKIAYKGKSLPLGGPLKEWTSVLGNYSREFQDAGRYVWDDIGVMVMDDRFRKDVKNSVISVSIAFNKCEELNYYPKNLYSSNVIIDGAEFNINTPIHKRNFKKREPFFYEGYMPGIYTYRLDDHTYVRLDLNPDKKIRELSLSVGID
jgi:hypothetical protein